VVWVFAERPARLRGLGLEMEFPAWNSGGDGFRFRAECYVIYATEARRAAGGHSGDEVSVLALRGAAGFHGCGIV